MRALERARWSQHRRVSALYTINMFTSLLICLMGLRGFASKRSLRGGWRGDPVL